MVACESVMADFTSITSSAPRAAWNASTSIEPRSPQIANKTSTSTSTVHPAARSRETIASTMAACASSTSRSSWPPPPQPDLEIRVQGPRRLDQRAHRDTLDAPAVDRRDQRSREPRIVRDVLLAPSLPNTQGAELAAEARRVHSRMMGGASSPALM